MIETKKEKKIFDTPDLTERKTYTVQEYMKHCSADVISLFTLSRDSSIANNIFAKKVMYYMHQFEISMFFSDTYSERSKTLQAFETIIFLLYINTVDHLDAYLLYEKKSSFLKRFAQFPRLQYICRLLLDHKTVICVDEIYRYIHIPQQCIQKLSNIHTIQNRDILFGLSSLFSFSNEAYFEYSKKLYILSYLTSEFPVECNYKITPFFSYIIEKSLEYIPLKNITSEQIHTLIQVGTAILKTGHSAEKIASFFKGYTKYAKQNIPADYTSIAHLTPYMIQRCGAILKQTLYKLYHSHSNSLAHQLRYMFLTYCYTWDI